MEDLSKYTNPRIDEQIFFSASDQSLRAAKSYVEMGLNRKRQLAMYFPHQADVEMLAVRVGNHPLFALYDKLPRYPQESYTEFPLAISLSARDIWMIMTEYEESCDEFQRDNVNINHQWRERLQIDQKVLDELYQDFTSAGGFDFDGRITYTDELLTKLPSSRPNFFSKLLTGIWAKAKVRANRSDEQKISS